MRVPDILAPISGAIALGVAAGLVGIYAHGRAKPVEHHATVEVTVDAPPEVVGALLVDLERRPDWRPHVERIGRVDDTSDGREVWRELDAGGDRFELVVAEASPERLVLEVARPMDIGIRARWTWSVEPAGSGSRIVLTEDGAVDNLFFRGWWSLVYGPYAAIEQDLTAFAGVLGSTVAPVRVE